MKIFKRILVIITSLLMVFSSINFVTPLREAQAAVEAVFQADFNGSGAGTGGAGDLVTIGGTGAMLPGAGTTAVLSEPSMGDGSFVRITAPGGATPRVRFTPATAANSLASMWSKPGEHALLNGAIEFLFRSAEGMSATTPNQAFRPLDTWPLPAGGLRLVLHNIFNNQIRIHIMGAGGLSITREAIFNMLPNTVYRFGITFSTDAATGITTASLFVAEGTGRIDTSGIPMTQFTFNMDEANITQGFTGGTFDFGMLAGIAGESRTQDFDRLRIYNSVPAEFAEIRHTLTMAAEGQGSIVPAGGGHIFAANTVVELTAAPVEGWRFSHWVGGVTNTLTATTTVSMDRAKTVTAHFTQYTPTIPVTAVTVSPENVAINSGATKLLTASIVPADATNRTVTWTSTNTAVATVDANGLVTAVAAGAAAITATTADGRFTATSAITVLPIAPLTRGVFLGLNDSIRAAWEGNFGSQGYLLIGQNIPRPPGWGRGGFVENTAIYVIGREDIAVWPTYVVDANWHPHNSFAISPDDKSTDGRVLNLPAGRPGSKVWSWINAAIHHHTGIREPLTLTVRVNTDEPFVFTVFGNGNVLELLDLEGNRIDSSPNVHRGNVILDGVYISYLVQGSFRVRFTEGAASIFGFFFDAPDAGAGVPANLTAVRGEGRNINLSWTNSGTPARVVLERSTDNRSFRQIAAFTAGETSFTDSNLDPGLTYYYRLRNVRRNAAGVSLFGASSDTASVSIPAMQIPNLAFAQMDPITVNVGETVLVSVNLTTTDNQPLADNTVYLKLRGPNVGDGVSLGQEIPEHLASGVTASNGTATVSFVAEITGTYDISAYTRHNDILNLAGATTAIPIRLSVNNVTPAVSPAVFRLSDAVKPGGLFSINGSDLNDNASLRVWIKSNTGDPVSFEGAVAAEIVQRDREGRFLAARLPGNVGPGVFNVWVENEHGRSDSYLLNTARPLFMSDYEIYPGIEIMVSGRNFKGIEFGAANALSLRLNDGAGRIRDALIKSANSYRITFAIAQGVELGRYFVEISNDGGRNWVRLTSGQTLTVVDPGDNPDPLGLGVAWARDFNWDDRFSVIDFGATGNDATNDTLAVQAAVDAAAANPGGGVVFFPDGKYYIDTVTLPSKVVLLGESREHTRLYYTNNLPGRNFINTLDAVVPNHTGVIELQGVANLSLLLAHPNDPNARPDSFMWLGHRWSAPSHNMHLRTANRMFVHNVKIDYSTENDATIGGRRGMGYIMLGRERTLSQSNHFVGFNVAPFIGYVNEYSILRNNHFEYTAGVVVRAANYSFLTGNRLLGVNRHLTRWSQGLITRANSHVEGNYVEGMGAQGDGVVYPGEGESIMVECPLGYYNGGRVLKATANSVTVAPKVRFDWPRQVYGDLSVIIIDGRGKGQLRQVRWPEAYMLGSLIGNFTLEVTEPFDVVPDSTSRFTFYSPLQNVTIHDNHVVDNARGIWLYNAVFDAVVANNISERTDGVLIDGIEYPSALTASYFIRVAGNMLSGVSRRTGVGAIGFRTHRDVGHFAGTGVYAIEILNNSIVSGEYMHQGFGLKGLPSGLRGIHASATIVGRFDGIHGKRDAVNTIISGNRLDNLPVGVHVSRSNYGLIVKDNYYTDRVTNFLHSTETITDMGVTGVNTIIRENTRIVVVPVTGVTVAPETARINVGETQQLTAVVSPANATNQAVTWTSNNPAAATVSETGLVTGVGAGEAVITVRTEDGGLTAISTITIIPIAGRRITVELRNSENLPVQGAEVRLGISGWPVIGHTGADGKLVYTHPTPLGNMRVRVIAPNNGGTKDSAVQDTLVNPVFQLQTHRIIIRLLNHRGNPLSGGEVRIGHSGWPVIGVTNLQGELHHEMFPGTYSFRMTFNATTRTLTQDISTPVLFQTIQARVKLVDHLGNPLSGGIVRLGANGWPIIGTTGDGGPGMVLREMFPGNYSFRMSFNHGTETKSHDISTPVVFQTGLLDLRFNGTIHHGVSGWPLYVRPTEMLAIEHRFRFTRNDGTRWEARYTPTAGEVLTIQIP